MAARPRDTFGAPQSWKIYKRQPGFVLGFHGCDRVTGESILSGQTRHLHASDNSYDWLGGGIYFWESDPWRALDWARDAAAGGRKTASRIEKPYLVGAVIDLGHCCNLLDVDSCVEVAETFALIALFAKVGMSIPVNTGGREAVMRYRDRMVIDTMHALRKVDGRPAFDSVRAAFLEGPPLYDGAGFRHRNHIQIAVCNPACIKGYFRLPDF